jgi:hypothetical protein
MDRQALQLLDRPIAFHRCFVPLCGSVHAALMLSQAIYWSLRTRNPEGWFYKSLAEWQEETGMTRRELDTAREHLRRTGFWEEDLRKVPAVLHYRVNQDIMTMKLAGYSTLTMHKSAKLDAQNSQASLAESAKHLLLTETTTETTQKENITSSGHNFSPPGFQKFWEAYPYKRDADPREARNAWFRSGFAEREAETVLAGLELWKASDEWQDERLVPSPERFIRGRRWETFPPKKKASKHEKTAAAVKRFLEGTDSEVAPEVGKAFQH